MMAGVGHVIVMLRAKHLVISARHPQSLGSKFPDCDKLRESVLAGDLVTEVRPGQVGDVRGPCLGGPRDPVSGVVVPRQGDVLGVVELPPQPGLVSPQGKQEDLE